MNRRVNTEQYLNLGISLLSEYEARYSYDIENKARRLFCESFLRWLHLDRTNGFKDVFENINIHRDIVIKASKLSNEDAKDIMSKVIKSYEQHVRD